MDTKEILILAQKHDSRNQWLQRQGIKVEDVFKGSKVRHNKFRFMSLFGLHKGQYGFDEDLIKKYNKILVMETEEPRQVVKDIKKWNPCADIKFWMLNIVDDFGYYKIKALQDLGVECFTFDRGDCEKYAMSYNVQLYQYDEALMQKEFSTKYDCYFCGKDKGRLPILLKLKEYLEANGLTYYFRMVKDKRKVYSEADLKGIEVMQKGIDYDTVLQETLQSKCIIDIVQEGQRGLTLRPFEALFYKRKLITNNREIKEFDFYKPQNIFILENNFEGFREFLKTPLIPLEESIFNRYSYTEWLKNFWKY